MKKIISVLLCGVLLGMLCLPAAAAEPVGIATPEDLKAIGDNPRGTYRLEADIDLVGMDWVPIPFSGVLDGSGHTLYNLQIRETGAERAVSVDGNRKPYDTTYAGLFSVVEGAQIRDLTILGADVEIETDEHCFAAILAGYMKDTTLENCWIEGRVHLYTTNKMVGVGGLAGFGRGEITGCHADVELVFADRSEGIRCEQFLGGMLACGNAALLNNTVDIRGYDACYGYVHNGGLVGMHYCYDEAPPTPIVGNTVTGKISFFEKNPQRRAYCDAFGGELLSQPAQFADNQSDFLAEELRDAVGELGPELCENPIYIQEPVSPDCTHWGYTNHTCGTCGYTYRTDYAPPAHTPGEWETLQEPTYEAPGKARKSCTACGAVLEEKELPARIPADSCQLLPETLKLSYKESAVLTPRILPEEVSDRAVVWSSSDEQVAVVDRHGQVRATGRGEAVITCRTRDGLAEASCPVTVGFAPWQWLIETLLFGWAWY